MAYTYKGQSGKSLPVTDTGSVAWTAKMLRMSGQELSFASLDDDWFIYSSSCDDSTGTGVTLPEEWQAFEIWSGSARKFRGTVTAVIPGLKSVSVRVDGPWWWMRKIELTGDFPPPFDSAGATAERHNFAFPQQGLGPTFQALIARFIALGVPIGAYQGGDIDTSFTCTTINLPNMSCADAWAAVLQFLPDAVSWIDYSATDGTLPRLRISRRSAMGSSTYTIGTDRFDERAPFTVRPRLELQLTRTEIHYADRDPTTHKPRYQSQKAGDLTSAAKGKIQITTISGPESYLLPKDSFDTIRIRTTNTYSASFISTRDTTLAPLTAEYGAVGGPANGITGWFDAGNTRYQATIAFPATTTKNLSGADVDLTGRYLLLGSDQLPDWAVKELDAQQVTIAGTWVGYTDVTGSSQWSPAYRAWSAMAVNNSELSQTYGHMWANSTPISPTRYWFAMPFSVTVWHVNTAFPARVTYYRAADYEYAFPPANLASNFLACQNWVVYEGEFTLVENSLSLNNLLGIKVNIANSRAALATMGTLVKRLTYKIDENRRRFELGAPARMDLGTAMNRVRKADGGVVY